MRGPSSPPDARGRRARLAVAAVAAACGCARRPAAPPAPEADPALATARAAALVAATPSVGSVPFCTPADLADAPGLTRMMFRTVAALAGRALPETPEFAGWINPAELESPAARELAPAGGAAGPPGAQAGAASSSGEATRRRRQAAATFLASTGYVVYRIDNVNAPLALGVKELKRGTVSARAIRHEADGRARCASVFVWQNTKERSDWAIEHTDKALVDPAVAKALQDDLRAQLLLAAPRAGR